MLALDQLPTRRGRIGALKVHIAAGKSPLQDELHRRVIVDDCQPSHKLLVNRRLCSRRAQACSSRELPVEIERRVLAKCPSATQQNYGSQLPMRQMVYASRPTAGNTFFASL